MRNRNVYAGYGRNEMILWGSMIQAEKVLLDMDEFFNWIDSDNIYGSGWIDNSIYCSMCKDNGC